jgi:lipopolysaccharide export system protein LptA
MKTPLAKLLLLGLFTVLIYAQKVQITSESFYAKDAEKQVHFINNVLVKQGKSWIHSDKVIVYFDDNNQTIQYDAIGNATYEVYKEKNHYKGHSDKVTYYPETSVYMFTGDAVIDDINNNRQINGNIVVVNAITGDADVKSTNKTPVKFIFDIGGN